MDVITNTQIETTVPHAEETKDGGLVRSGECIVRCKLENVGSQRGKT